MKILRKIGFFLLFPLLLASFELSPPARKLLKLMEIPEMEDKQVPKYLQEHWVQKGKECWQMQTLSEEKKEAALPILEEIGCIAAIHASKNDYDYALLLGAMGGTMQRRLDFLYEEHLRGIRFSEVILLSGDRKLDPTMETVPEGVENEAGLLLHLFEQHPLSKLVSATLIDTPATSIRPTTATTFLQWLKRSPKPGRCLAVSSQPFVKRQEAIGLVILPNDFSVEGIGPAAMSHYPLAIFLDNFAKWLVYEQMK